MMIANVDHHQVDVTVRANRMAHDLPSGVTTNPLSAVGRTNSATAPLLMNASTAASPRKLV